MTLGEYMCCVQEYMETEYPLVCETMFANQSSELKSHVAGFIYGGFMKCDAPQECCGSIARHIRVIFDTDNQLNTEGN